MSSYAPRLSKFGIIATFLVVTMILWSAQLTFADPGHIGEKPPNADGDGVPTNADPDFAYGSRNGEQLATGDANQGDDPVSGGGDGIPNGGPTESQGYQNPPVDGGDGIPNGGPIEGTGHKGKGAESFSISGFLGSLF